MASCASGVFVLLVLGLFAGKVKSTTCWSTWVNDAKPAADGSVTEIASPTELAKLCPNGVIDAQCADDKGEPFHGNKSDNVNRYNASCSKDQGLHCQPLDSSKACPDMKIQYGCVCPTTAAPGAVTKIPATTTTARPTTPQPVTAAPETSTLGPTTPQPASTKSPSSGNNNNGASGPTLGQTTVTPGPTSTPSPNAGPGSNLNQKQRGGTFAQCGNGSQKGRFSVCIMFMVILVNVLLKF